MAEKLNLPNIPRSSMFMGEEKTMTIEWQEFFRILYERVGGTTSTTIVETYLTDVSSTFSTPVNYTKRIDELEKRLLALSEPINYAKRIGNLEALIYTQMGQINTNLGLAFGSFHGDHVGWSQATAVQNTWYNISDASISDGELNYVAHDGNGKLTVVKPGFYLINYSITIEDNVANDHVEVGIEKNGSGSAEAAGVSHVESKFANEEEALSSTAIFNLSAGDTVELAVRTTDIGTPTISVQDINLTIVRLK